jgi:hypothetical protein
MGRWTARAMRKCGDEGCARNVGIQNKNLTFVHDAKSLEHSKTHQDYHTCGSTTTDLRV